MIKNLSNYLRHILYGLSTVENIYKLLSFEKTIIRSLSVCLVVRLSSVSYIQHYQSKQKISFETT